MWPVMSVLSDVGRICADIMVQIVDLLSNLKIWEREAREINLV
jgi:hypothetical protein